MIIGVTGSFGSGKTTVSKMFAGLGAYVIDADRIYHSLILPGNKLHKKLIKNFSRTLLRKDDRIDRRELAEMVFKDTVKLKKLNHLAHPEVIKEIEKILAAKKDKVVIVDAALLIESGFHKKMDKVVLVKIDTHTQVRRLMRRRRMKKSDVLKRVKMQLALEKKLAYADFIIDNSGSKMQTMSRVRKIWDLLRSDL